MSFCDIHVCLPSKSLGNRVTLGGPLLAPLHPFRDSWRGAIGAFLPRQEHRPAALREIDSIFAASATLTAKGSFTTVST
jgi:hypothetical protein